VYLLCRSQEKASLAKQTILAAHAHAKVEFVKLNLACLRDVQACVAEVRRRERVVDVLVCNAGVVGGEYGLTEDGIERGFQVNYLGMYGSR
jgi:NAD(P)-dependent dehydrogenase (short-subunit alcohol dehydrogenase family)